MCGPYISLSWLCIGPRVCTLGFDGFIPSRRTMIGVRRPPCYLKLWLDEVLIAVKNEFTFHCFAFAFFRFSSTRNAALLISWCDSTGFEFAPHGSLDSAFSTVPTNAFSSTRREVRHRTRHLNHVEHLLHFWERYAGPFLAPYCLILVLTKISTSVLF